MTELLFHNADVYTMDPARPRANAVAVRDGRIVAIGNAAAPAAGGDAQRIDCEGGLLAPAFIDAHCHLLSYAASLRSVDCTGARSIPDIQRAIAERAAKMAPGRWIRAFGYEETSLAERRHPQRNDLDAPAPRHPVRLIHRSGHAGALNSLALRELGIAIDTEEPRRVDRARSRDGRAERRADRMEDVIDRALPRPAVRRSCGRCAKRRGVLRAGIVCAQDASHTNGPDEWRPFSGLIGTALPIDVVLMEGWVPPDRCRSAPRRDGCNAGR
jgi:predicted amidohydrolase YtcJ